MRQLDIIIPVYNEGENIALVLSLLERNVATPFRVLICYDHDSDNTLPVVRNMSRNVSFEVTLIKNHGRGPHDAVIAGFNASDAGAVLVLPADDTQNAEIIDRMYEKIQQGYDIVAACRPMKSKRTKGYSWLKSFLVRSASFTLNRLVGIPINDVTNGSRMFSQRLIDTVMIESSRGFAYSLELLVKCHRLRWNIAELPASWCERKKGQGNFHLFKWLPDYLRWYFYGYVTKYCRKTPRDVKLKCQVLKTDEKNQKIPDPIQTTK